MGELSYFYCKKCNKGVDARVALCDTCGKRFFGGREPDYTEEEIKELIRNSEAPISLENAVNETASVTVSEETCTDGDMVCPRCGKRYDITHSRCTCGSMLETYYESVEITETPVEREETGEVYGDVIDSSWKLKVRRFVGCVPQEGNKEIELKRSITSMGRFYVANNHIFSYDTQLDSNSFNKVSAFNAIFMVEDGKLFVQYDRLDHVMGNRLYPKDKERATLYVNGMPLSLNQRCRLTEGDSVLMGKNATWNMDRCLEFIVEKIEKKEQVQQVNNIALDELKKQIDELGDKMDYSGEMAREILGNTKDIKQSIEELNELQSKNHATVTAHMESMQRFTAKYLSGAKAKTKKEYVDIFLKDCDNKEEFLACLNEVQMDYLESAAVVTYALMESGIDDLDYSGAFIYLGKLLENFLNNSVAELLETYNKAIWENQKKDQRTGRPKKTLYIGDYTMAIANAYATPERKMFKSISNEVKHRKNGIEVAPEEVARQFLMIDDIRQIRNDSAHSSMELVLSDKVVRVDKNSFIEAFDIIVNHSFITEITKYHRIIFKR